MRGFLLKMIAGVIMVTCVRAWAAGSAPVNPYQGMQTREEVFEFAEKPAVEKEGDRYVVTFAAKGACDATVSIVDADGLTVRHLASGVLGKNAPPPFEQGTLKQRIAWDGEDDQGKPVPADVLAGSKVKVSLGLKASYGAMLAPQSPYAITPTSIACDAEGNALLIDADFLRRISPEGRVETLNPLGGSGPPAAPQGEPLRSARFRLIMGSMICFDDRGNLYVADRWNHCVRKVDLRSPPTGNRPTPGSSTIAPC